MTTEVRLLGEVRVFGGGQWHFPLFDKRLGLLSYLACQGSWVEREKLAFLFWPDAGDEQARTNLRGLLARSKELPFARELDVETTRLRWPVDCDVRVFRQATENEAWDEAVSHYGGELLAGASFDDASELSSWLEMERERLKEAHRNAVFHHSNELQETGRVREAVKLLDVLLARDALDEEALQRSMRLLAESGRPKHALRTYRNFSRRLSEKLNLEPTSTTVRLAQAIEADEVEAFKVRSGPSLSSRSSPSATPPPAAARRAEAKALPTQLTSFVGRDLELAELAHLLSKPECRLLTLTGTAGVGKTRLALQAAQELSKSHPDGTYFVPLDAATSARAVPTHIANALGINLHGQDDTLTLIIRWLGDQSLLLVLDNYEQLMEGASITLELLRGCPNLNLLVTSRERLDLAEEWVLPLKGLAYPAVGASLEEAQASDAIQFFLERARQIQPRYNLSEKVLPEILQICRLVDGLPLGLELAVVWLRVMPVVDIAKEIEGNLGFLSSTRNLPERHQSIRAAFEHSWRLLTPKEQEVLRTLSVFRGGFRREAAAYVAGASIAILAALVDKSLLRVSPEGRYDRHPLLHQYTLEKLAKHSQEEAEAKGKHAGYFVALIEEAERQFEVAGKAMWGERVEAEYDNLRGALDWAVGNSQSDLALRLAGSLFWFWVWRGMVREAREWLGKVVSMPSLARTAACAKVFTDAGNKACVQGDFDAGQSLCEEGLAIARESGDKKAIADALNMLGTIAYFRGDYREARSFIEENLAIARELGDKRGIGIALADLAMIERFQGEYAAARALLEDSLAIMRELGDEVYAVYLLAELAYLAREQGRHTLARSLIEESLSLVRESGNRIRIAHSQYHLGLLAHDQGDYALARSLHAASLKTRWDVGAGLRAGESLEAIAALRASEGEAEQAACLWGMAEVFREVRSIPLPPNERTRYDQDVTAARAQLEEGHFEAAWAKGRAMDLAQAVAYALEVLGPT